MPSIKVRGYGEIEVDIRIAKQLSKMKEDGNTPPSTWIKAGKWSGNFGDISGVVCIETSNRPINENDSLSVYLKERKEILSLSSEMRAKNLGLFKLYYFCIFEKDADNIILKKAEEYQKIYFDKYPNKCLCNYLVFNQIIFGQDKIPRDKKIGIYNSRTLTIIGEVEHCDRMNATIYKKQNEIKR